MNDEYRPSDFEALEPPLEAALPPAVFFCNKKIRLSIKGCAIYLMR